MPCPSGKAELQPSTLAALLVKYSRALVSALPWDLHKARARSRSLQEISVHVSQQKVPKELAAGDSVRGSRAMPYPEVQPAQQTGMYPAEMISRRVKYVHSHCSDVGHHPHRPWRH